MVLASNRNSGGYGLLQESAKPPLYVESSKLLTHRALILILMVLVLLPFVFSRLFISHITFLPTVEYTELPSSPSPLSSAISTSPNLAAFLAGDKPRTRRIQTPSKDQILHKQMHDEEKKQVEDVYESKHLSKQAEKNTVKTSDSRQEEEEDFFNLNYQEKQSIKETTVISLEDKQDKAEEDSQDLKHKDKRSAEKTTVNSLENQQERGAGDGHDHKHIERRVERETIVEVVPNQEEEHLLIDDPTKLIDFSVGGCNIWKGKWIPNHSPPAYTNVTCEFIQGHQNCLKNGRPDRKYLHWRWKPHDCELPPFNAKEFLKLVHGRAWAFVGDSIARNHFQSILCFLAQVESPENLYRDDKDLFVRWFFPSYNFTLAVFWSPFFVKWTEDDIEGLPSGTEKLHLDVVDKNWVSSIQEYDYVVFSAGHWFLRSSIYFTNDKVIGCHYVPGSNFTQLGFYYGLRTALQTMYSFLASSSYSGVVFFRTFTPDHFENGQWHDGGNCMKTTPTHNATLDGVTLEMYKIQLEEFGRALQFRNAKASFKIVDTIHASIIRADGHPGPYRNVGSSKDDLPQDCLHWCLPGAIDTWSAMLLEMLRHA